jgi:hypothetical protein
MQQPHSRRVCQSGQRTIASEWWAHTSQNSSSDCPESIISALSTVAADIYVDSTDVIHTQQGIKHSLGGELPRHGIGKT